MTVDEAIAHLDAQAAQFAACIASLQNSAQALAGDYADHRGQIERRAGGCP